MARYSTGVLTGAGSTTLPLISLYAPASVELSLREVGLSNPTATAVSVKLVRLTTTGTQGAGLVEAKYNPNSPAASGTAFTTHTVAPTLGEDLGFRAYLPAGGGGIVWPFGEEGLEIAPGTGNGIGVIVENGTGQTLQAWMVWVE